MKKILLIIILALTFTGELSAINQDTATLELRKKAYNRYLLLKDTTTVRTWMNMDRINKALIKVVEYDNKLIKLYRNNDSGLAAGKQPGSDTVISRPPAEVVKMPASNSDSDKDYIMAGLVACGILVIILLVLLIMRSISLNQVRRTLDESEETFNSKIKRMEFLESEVKKMKSREKEIKAELEKGIIDYQGKVQQLRLRIDELAEENSRLEGLLSAPAGENDNRETRSSGETVAIKQELIDKLETMLARLKDSNI